MFYYPSIALIYLGPARNSPLRCPPLLYYCRPITGTLTSQKNVIKYEPKREQISDSVLRKTMSFWWFVFAKVQDDLFIAHTRIFSQTKANFSESISYYIKLNNINGDYIMLYLIVVKFTTLGWDFVVERQNFVWKTTKKTVEEKHWQPILYVVICRF